ncbi:MAG: AAA family ATPase [Proteobacteria bacterium]|nr:AAA family ATPase [Pseudomonadota bacterium]
MLKKIHLENFKALKNIDLEFAKFNVLTGLNSTGKTSVLQSMAFLKQSISRKEIMYNDYLLRLGEYREAVHKHDMSLPIRIKVSLSNSSEDLDYDVTAAAKATREEFFINGESAWHWDTQAPGVVEPWDRVFLGQAASGYGGGVFAATTEMEFKVTTVLQKFMADWFENMLYLSSNRGFTKYSYPLLAGKPSIEDVSKRAGDMSLLEEWLANLILFRINEAKRYPDAKKQLDVMSERLSRLGVDASPYVLGGPSVVIDLTEGDMWVSAVNSGYGINQSVSSIILGTLFPSQTLITIEEPEMHLHPRMQKAVTGIFGDICNEGKQVIITSHSVHMLQSLRELVENGTLAPEDVKVYNFEKLERETKANNIDITDEKLLNSLF